MSLIFWYILSLIITILIEFGVIWIFIRKDISKLFLYTILINSFTLPLATFSYQKIINNFFFIETAVIFAESILIMLLLKTKYSKALLISFIANFITAMISLLFFIQRRATADLLTSFAPRCALLLSVVGAYNKGYTQFKKFFLLNEVSDRLLSIIK